MFDQGIHRGSVGQRCHRQRHTGQFRERFFGDLAIDLKPLHHELNRPVTIAANIPIGLEAGSDDALNFVGLLLDFLHTGHQTRLREADDFASYGDHIETQLLRFKVKWKAEQRA